MKKNLKNQKNVCEKSQKKWLVFVCVFLFIFTGFLAVVLQDISIKNYETAKNIKCVFAEEDAELQQQKFAKAKENCYLFKTSDISSSASKNVYFCVPKSYFVTILAELNSSVLKVEYKGKIGYVSKDSVVVASFVPIVPTLDDITLDIVSSSGTQIRSSPSAETSSNIIKILSAGTKDLEYVSYINSSKPTGGNSNVWYYVYYFPEDDPTAFYEGYVYSEKTTNLSLISENLEKNPEVETDGTKQESNTIFVSKSVKIILIVLILLPVVLVLIIAIFRSKNAVIIKQKNEQEDEQKQHQKERSKVAVKSLEGKHFILKKNEKHYDENFGEEIASITPIFPSYDVVDDDDLL